MKIWYLTRTYYPYQNGGGPLLRTGAVKYLEELGWEVTVVMPNYGSNNVNIDNNIIQIPFKHIQKFSSLLERLGIYEDYLDKWVKNAFEYLKNKVKEDDIVFATSGGELGMIKIGSLLEEKLGCKFIVNFHDPLQYGYMNGLRPDKKPHIGREKSQEKYLNNVDLIITSSQYYANVLSKRFSYLKDKIHNNYFGYVEPMELLNNTKLKDGKLCIAYVGTMGSTQKPEMLYEAYKRVTNKENIQLFFVGDRSHYKPLQKINDDNIKFIDFLPHDIFLKFMTENIDVGFVSLANDYYGACVPSKIYEYINLGLPILGALPEGDGKEIINTNNYGIACNYNDLSALTKAIETLQDRNYLEKVRINIKAHHDEWSMKQKIKEVDVLIQKLMEQK
ncbi:MAG: glycosyltransferase [Sulfurovum sp.]|nr:glycosyltransferase [Sulfurovum sp.]